MSKDQWLARYSVGKRWLDAILQDPRNEEEKRMIEEAYPLSEWLSFDEACRCIENMDDQKCGLWKMISEDRFEDFLNCLPPVKWERTAGFEVFRLSERYTSNIRTVCVRLGNKYFEAMFRDTVSNREVHHHLKGWLENLRK